MIEEMIRLANYSNGNNSFWESNIAAIYIFLALAGAIVITNTYALTKDKIKNYMERRRHST